MTDPGRPFGGEPVMAVVPFENAPMTAAKVIAAHLSGYLDLAAHILAPMAIPREALDDARLQYDAGTLIAAVEAMPLDDYFKIIALVDVDLFIPMLTHVFGEARQNGRVALVSLYRLGDPMDGSSPSAGRVLERLAKTALHEVGHLLNLLHCDDQRCLMHFSGNLEILDRTAFAFCRYCRRSVARALARTSP